MSRKVAQLDVYVGGVRTGLLSKADLWNYSYLSDATADVALTMPRSTVTYSHKAILPPFDQCLPEMDIGLFPAGLWKLVQPDEMGILWASGQNRLGRLRFAEPGQALGQSAGLRIQPDDFAHIADGEAFFLDAVSQLSSIPGVAGVQPKTLAQFGPTDPAAVTLDTHILKACKNDFPWVTVVESLCLQAAAGCGIETARHLLSGDGRLIAVERFDLDATGAPIGFDELCALSGRLSAGKYNGSYESLVKKARLFLPPERQEAEILKLFRHLVFCYAIENGDAHWKNFGLVYDDPNNARLSPAYDLVNTTCFPALRHDAPALTLNGRKVWDGAAKDLRQLGIEQCLLSRSQIKTVFEQIATGLSEMNQTVSGAKQEFPGAAEYLERMEQAWARGRERLTA